MRPARVVAIAATLTSLSCEPKPTQPESSVPVRATGSGNINNVGQYGLNMGCGNLLETDEAGMRRMAGLAKQAGARWARFCFQWHTLQSDTSTWTPLASQYDLPLQVLADSGISVFATLQGTPHFACWTDKCATASDKLWAPENYFVWQTWISEVVGRYPSINYWGIWNEPSNDANFRMDSGTTLNERVWRYRDLVTWARDPIRAAGKYVVALEDGNIPFAQAFLAWPYTQDFDVISTHIYHRSRGTEDHVAEIDALARATYPGGKPIWLTESGLELNANSSHLPEQDEYQATHTTRVLQRMNAGRIANWQKTFVYHMFWPYDVFPNQPYPAHTLILNAFSANPSPRLAFGCMQAVATGATPKNACTFHSECAPGNPASDCAVATIYGPEAVRSNLTCGYSVGIANGGSPIGYQWKMNGAIVGTEPSVSVATGTSAFVLTVRVTEANRVYGDTVNVAVSSTTKPCLF